MKKIQILALSALLLTMPLAIVEPVYAADGTKQEQQQKRPPRRPGLTLEEMQTVLSQKYFVTPEETKSLIDSGTGFRDLERAAKLSYVSGKPVKDILALKKDEPWQRVEVLIGGRKGLPERPRAQSRESRTLVGHPEEGRDALHETGLPHALCESDVDPCQAFRLDDGRHLER